MTKLRLGMVGGGPGAFIGPVHLMAARLDDRFALSAGAFSRNEGKNRQAGEGYGLSPERVYASWQDMLAAEKGQLDLIAIVTPNDTHCPMAKAALEAVFNVLCDKAATLNRDEALAGREVVQINGKAYGLTPTESILLHVLLRNASRVVENRMLIARVWPSEEVYEDTLRVHMHRLRRKLEADSHHPHYIRTERGVGYMFTARPPEGVAMEGEEELEESESGA